MRYPADFTDGPDDTDELERECKIAEQELLAKKQKTDLNKNKETT